MVNDISTFNLTKGHWQWYSLVVERSLPNQMSQVRIGKFRKHLFLLKGKLVQKKPAGDGMAKLSVHYFDIYSNEDLPKLKKFD